MPPGHDMIEFDKDCKWDNFMSPNYTSSRPFARPLKTWSSELERPILPGHKVRAPIIKYRVITMEGLLRV